VEEEVVADEGDNTETGEATETGNDTETGDATETGDFTEIVAAGNAEGVPEDGEVDVTKVGKGGDEAVRLTWEEPMRATELKRRSESGRRSLTMSRASVREIFR